MIRTTNSLSKIYIVCLLAVTISACKTTKESSMGNFIARMEVTEPIDGVCDNANVIAVLPLPGSNQIPAVAPMTDEEIAKLLNTEVSFLKDKPDYNDKGMVNMIVNCKGEMVQCRTDTKTKSPELDAQILAVFTRLKNWTAGKVNNQSVDTVNLTSYTIENGVITL